MKNPHAVALGRMGGKKGGRNGGHARARKLSPERRSEIARNAARARWRRQSNGGKNFVWEDSKYHRYPWPELELGEAFRIEVTPENRSVAQCSALASAQVYYEGTGLRLTTRSTDYGLSCRLVRDTRPTSAEIIAKAEEVYRDLGPNPTYDEFVDACPHALSTLKRAMGASDYAETIARLHRSVTGEERARRQAKPWKLTDEMVAEIEAAKGEAPAEEVAFQYDVSRSTVYSVWREAEPEEEVEEEEVVLERVGPLLERWNDR